MPTNVDVIVIGGGQAALVAAIAAKEEGARVALITRCKRRKKEWEGNLVIQGKDIQFKQAATFRELT